MGTRLQEWKEQIPQVYREVRVREVNPTFNLDFLTYICILNTSDPALHTSPGGQCLSSAGHCLTVGSLIEPLMEHLNIQMS